MIRIDMAAVEKSKLKLNQNVLKSTQIGERLPSAMYQVDYAITARRSIRLRMDQLSSRTREMERKLRELQSFIQMAQEKHSGIESMLNQQASNLRKLSGIAFSTVPPGAANDYSKLKDVLDLIAKMLGSAADWVRDWWDNMSTTTKTGTMPLRAGTQISDDQPSFAPYDPSKLISLEDILNRDDPEAYQRLMDGPFGQWSKEKQKEFIKQVERDNREYEKKMEKYEYGSGFADGFGHGIEKSIQGLIDMISNTVQHPIQTGEAIVNGAVDGIKQFTSDPWGSIKKGASNAWETGEDFWYAGWAKKGDYIGSVFTGLFITRGISKIPSIIGKRKGGSDSDSRQNDSDKHDSKDNNDSDNNKKGQATNVPDEIRPIDPETGKIIYHDWIPAKPVDLNTDKYLIDKVAEARSGLSNKYKDKGNFAYVKADIEGLDQSEFFAHSKISDPNKKIPGAEKFSLDPENPSFPATKAALNEGKGEVILRDMDTEYKILNDIDKKLNHNKEAKGTIVLFTEKDTCGSCNLVISRFKEHYPNITIEIVHNNGDLIDP